MRSGGFLYLWSLSAVDLLTLLLLKADFIPSVRDLYFEILSEDIAYITTKKANNRVMKSA